MVPLLCVCYLTATKYDAAKAKESKRKRKAEELLAIEQAQQRALEEKCEFVAEHVFACCVCVCGAALGAQFF